MEDERIAKMAQDFLDGKYGKGLNAKRRLGSDYIAVISAAYPTRAKKSLKSEKAKAKDIKQAEALEEKRAEAEAEKSSIALQEQHE